MHAPLTFCCDTLDLAPPAGPVAPPAGVKDVRILNSYDCVNDFKKRKPPVSLLRSEDDELLPIPRGQAISVSRDVRRNFSIAAWAIRKHLDYVSTFHFRCRTGNRDLDARVEQLVRWWSARRNFDRAGRHSRQRMVRLLEASRTVDGDVGVLKLNDGRIQSIEGDRIRTPMAWPEGQHGNPDWLPKMKHGVVLDKAGKALGFAVNKRGIGFQYGPDWFFAANSFVFERLIPAKDLLLHGYFDRIDQVRGISPITAALNSYRDVYEGFDYALAQAKVAQLFALAIKRNSIAALTEFENEANRKPTNYADQLDFNRGAALLDLDPGDDAVFLSSNNPSSNWQAFMNLVIAASLKSLDIPYCFYDESRANYSSMRSAWLLYDQSAEHKREDNRELLTELLAWRMAMWVFYGILELPAGITLGQLLEKCEWVAAGVPWIDPIKDIQASKVAVDIGLDSTPAACREMGLDAYNLVDEQADYLKYRAQKGLPPPGTAPGIPVHGNDENVQQTA